MEVLISKPIVGNECITHKNLFLSINGLFHGHKTLQNDLMKAILILQTGVGYEARIKPDTKNLIISRCHKCLLFYFDPKNFL